MLEEQVILAAYPRIDGSCKLEMHSTKGDKHKEKTTKMSIPFLIKSHASFDTGFHRGGDLGCSILSMRQTPERACTKTIKCLREMSGFVKMNFRYWSVTRAFYLLLVQNWEEWLMDQIVTLPFRGTWMGWRNGLGAPSKFHKEK